jgi:ABC-type transport system involved in multi-copper enzyme maturation permease subunit
MGESRAPAGPPELLYYRPWRGPFRRPAASVWPIARVALGMMLRRRLFWAVYGLGLVVFAMFFFGQYMLAWAQGQMGEGEVEVGGLGRADPRSLIHLFRHFLKIDGSGESYRTFFIYQVFMVMVVLALAGAVLVGNDLRFGSLPYYLSKPLSRRHYLLGKGLAVAVFINLMTTLPALILYVQNGLVTDVDFYSYFVGESYLFFGILGYGLVLTVSLTLILLATALWLRRTVPLIMAWTTLFYFCRLLTQALVDGLKFPVHWRLLDLWNDALLIGDVFLRVPPQSLRNPQPPAWEAALVLGGVSLSCLTYLVLRIRAVEIVR